MRAKAYPTNLLGAQCYMGGILRYLGWEFRAQDCDLYRCLGLCEAISIIEFCREAVRQEIYKGGSSGKDA